MIWSKRCGSARTELFLKISPGGFIQASRNKRELSVVRELGMETLVMTKGEVPGVAVRDGWQVLQLSTRPLGDSVRLVHLNRAISMITWATRARRLRASVISGHDLLGLFIAWLSTWLVPKNRRPLLVYDSHEFTIALASPRTRWLVRHLEAFLIRRCAFSIMVNDGIAERVKEIHDLPEKPLVVRNIPSLWQIDQEKRTQRRAEFCRELGLPSDSFLTMYHGVVVPDRGVEVSIYALVGRESVALVVLGNGDPAYLKQLRRLTQELGVEDRVLFHDAVPLEVLGEYVGAVDVGMVIVRADTENNHLMLPNKFFENIQSSTPIIASDFPEIGTLVRHYDIGILVDPDDVAHVGAAIDRLRSDSALREQLRKNLDAAKTELCWENERTGLLRAYGALQLGATH